MPKQLPRLDKCLNCGESVHGSYCSSCGQEAENRTVSVRLLIGDFVSEVWGYDSKLFRTLRQLIQRPGQLTIAYNAGKRSSYLAPLKMFLVLNVLFFLLFARGSLDVEQPVVTSTTSPANGTSRRTTKGRAFGVSISELPKTQEEYIRDQNALSRAKRDDLATSFLKRQVIKLSRDPEAFLHAFLENVPAVMFVLLPVFAFLLKLIYIRSGRLYAEHLIFALHTHSFVYLVQILLHTATAALEKLPIRMGVIETLGGLSVFGGILWTIAYLYKAMRKMYGQGRLKTLAKFCLLGFGYFFALVLSMVVVAAYTFVRF